MIRQKAKVLSMDPPAGARILAISDIHGNLPLFRGLLTKGGYRPGEDYLILLGDYVEKGPDSLATVRYLMEFSQTQRVFLLMGNCDTVWEDILTEEDCHTLSYMRGRPQSILHEMCREIGFVVSDQTTIEELRAALRPRFLREMEFLRDLPQVIETPQFLFVHAGLHPGPLEEQDAWGVMKYDYFLTGCEAPRDRYMVVGHMPVNNYCCTVGNATPILDRKKKIVSIDGGNILRIGGQLNLLLIPDAHKEQFFFCSADMLPSVRVIQRQEGTEDSVHIPWQDNGVELLEGGEEFSLCRQLSSGRKLWIANRELLHFPDGSLHCREATDHFLDVAPGECVKLVYRCRERSYCKKQGRMGWVENVCLDPEGAVLSDSLISPVFPL